MVISGMKRKTAKLRCAATMPPLAHTIPREVRSVESSEVIGWLLQQPSIRQYVFDKAKEYLVFDAETRTWRGCEYHGD
jgi:hypothetical protein